MIPIQGYGGTEGFGGLLWRKRERKEEYGTRDTSVTFISSLVVTRESRDQNVARADQPRGHHAGQTIVHGTSPHHPASLPPSLPAHLNAKSQSQSQSHSIMISPISAGRRSTMIKSI